MIRLVGSRVKNPDNLENIPGIRRIIRIAERLKLPYWWVESAIVEYLPCRRFVEKGELYVFNFEFSDNFLVDNISQYQVIAPGGSMLMQNISPEDFAFRSPQLMVGAYAEPLDQADLVPEGLANSNAWLFQANSISVSDPKVGFNLHAIVCDDGYFYQYKIAESYEITNKSMWYRSDLFDLMPLWDIMNRIWEYQNEMNNPRYSGTHGKIITWDHVRELFELLEETRKPIREKIFQYHLSKKGSYDTGNIISQEVPLLTFNESIRPVKNGFEIISHIEPLLYRSAYANYNMANKAKSNQKVHDLKHQALQDEIEYSTVSIICSISCLESYINGIIRKHLPNYLEILDMSHEKKWINVIRKFNPSAEVKKETEPVRSFIRLIGLRDKAVHYKPEYRKAIKDSSDNSRKNISYTYFNFNHNNAKFGIDVIHKMISLLAETSGLHLPRWLPNNGK